MTPRAKVGEILASAEDTATRHLYFCALLSNERGGQQRPLIVVGGSAIELYTAGEYVSGDIDIVGDRNSIESTLQSWGFAHRNREWYSEEWKLAVDVVNDFSGMTGSRTKIRTLVTPFGPVRLAAVEDLIIKRLTSAKYWYIPSDREHAAILARKYRDELDRDYIVQSAASAGVSDEWQELDRELSSRSASRTESSTGTGRHTR
jgi:hypothetical protein